MSHPVAQPRRYFALFEETAVDEIHVEEDLARVLQSVVGGTLMPHVEHLAELESTVLRPDGQAATEVWLPLTGYAAAENQLPLASIVEITLAETATISLQTVAHVAKGTVKDHAAV